MKQETMIMGEDQKFKKLAKKIRMRKITISVILIVITAFVALVLWNYKDAGFKPVPSIVLSQDQVYYDHGMYTVYYSLGFKHVLYESEYGRNYYERLMLWDKVDTDHATLTSSQYNQMTEQVKKYFDDQLSDDQIDGLKAVRKYFKATSTFNAAILDVEKDNNTITVYMNGSLERYLEYDGEVYGKVDVLTGDDGKTVTGVSAYAEKYGDRSAIRMVVTGVIEKGNFKAKDIKNCTSQQEFGEEGSKSLYDIFPKPVARIMLTGDYIDSTLGKMVNAKNNLDAAVYFGKPICEDKYLEYDNKTDKTKVIEITDESIHDLTL